MEFVVNHLVLLELSVSDSLSREHSHERSGWASKIRKLM
jgi:hypothetical protein